MSYSKSILSAVIAAAGLIALLQTAAATTAVVVKRDHRTPPIVRDHREKPVVRDHRGEEGRVRPTRSPKIICASWTC
jgi:hypothetical protein